MNEAQRADMDAPKRPQTLGEFRVRASFNPSSNQRVDDLKRRFADLIDDIERWKPEHGDPRVGSEAQTLLETAAMFAVKMVTTPRDAAPIPHPGVAGAVGGQGQRHG